MAEARRPSYFGTICTILEVCVTGERKAHILYWTGLKEEELARYLAAILEYGLLEVQEDEFRTTARGILFIQRYKALLESLNRLEDSREMLI